MISGMHTLLWLPRALQMRRELRAEEAQEEKRLNGMGIEGKSAGEDGNHAD